MGRIMSMIGEIRWFLFDRSPIRWAGTKTTRTESRNGETRDQSRERVGRLAYMPGTSRGLGKVNRMTKSEFVVLVMLLTFLTAILLFLSK